MDFANLWATPMFCFAVFMLVFAFGDFVSGKTRGLIPGALIGSIVYLVGFIAGWFPKDIVNAAGAHIGNAVTATTLATMFSAIGIMLIITNLGTIIDLKDLLAEWRTVIVALCSLLGVVGMSYTLNSVLFGRTYALCAAGPIAGGTVAAIMTQEAAINAGHPEFGAFAMLVVSCQMLIGMPIASFCVKKQADGFIKDGKVPAAEGGEKKAFNLRIIPEVPPKYNTLFLMMFKLAVVVLVANIINKLVPAINVNILYLICGVLFCEIGWLDKNLLTKANCNGFLTIALMSLMGNSYASLNLEQLLDMIIPIVGCLVLGAIGAMLVGLLVGKVFGWGVYASMAVAVCCLIGYPGTQIIVDDVCKGLDCPDEDLRAEIHAYFLPKLVVAGFTTVTVASVFITGIIAPTIFR